MPRHTIHVGPSLRLRANGTGFEAETPTFVTFNLPAPAPAPASALGPPASAAYAPAGIFAEGPVSPGSASAAVLPTAALSASSGSSAPDASSSLTPPATPTAVPPLFHPPAGAGAHAAPTTRLAGAGKLARGGGTAEVDGAAGNPWHSAVVGGGVAEARAEQDAEGACSTS